MMQTWSSELDIDVEILPDHHFLVPPEQFQAWANGRRSLVIEYFYRAERQRLGVLIDDDGEPEGGTWNYDAENRESFDRTRAYTLRPLEPDAVTCEVIDLIGRRRPISRVASTPSARR